VPEGASSEEVLLHLRKEEVTEHIQSFGEALAAEIASLGERVRRPQVVSERWSLLTEIQEFRGRSRALVSDLLFVSASTFASVTRTEVVPSFAEDLRDAIGARRAAADLARVMAVHQSRFLATPEKDRAGTLGALMRDLDAFGRSRYYALLRIADKRRIVELKGRLRHLPEAPSQEAAEQVKELVEFCRGLFDINRRAILIEHDREQLAACSAKLEEAALLAAAQPERALKTLGEGVDLAQALYGRHPGLDTYLRKARKRSLEGLSASEAQFEIELLTSLLAEAGG